MGTTIIIVAILFVLCFFFAPLWMLLCILWGLTKITIKTCIFALKSSYNIISYMFKKRTVKPSPLPQVSNDNP